MADEGEQVTLLLKAMRSGDAQAAEVLLPLVYAELHRVARSCMRRERPDHTLQATALINEAYMHLVGDDIESQNRAHFIGMAASVKRRPWWSMRERATQSSAVVACSVSRCRKSW